QPRKNGRRRNGRQPEPVTTQWLEEDGMEAPEQSAPVEEAAPFASQPGDSLDQIRKLVPWVTLTLFAVFPNDVTLAILVLSLALNGAQLWGTVRSMNMEHWGYVGLTLLAGGLRFWDLGLKALHHDESMHAYFSYLLFLNPS